VIDVDRLRAQHELTQLRRQVCQLCRAQRLDASEIREAIRRVTGMWGYHGLLPSFDLGNDPAFLFGILVQLRELVQEREETA
jgi:hypothetical protein